MCDLRDGLIDRTRELGARQVRIEHGGARGSPRRFPGHPHLTGEIDGRTFKYPVTARRATARGTTGARTWAAWRCTCGPVGDLPRDEPSDVYQEGERPCPD